MAKKIKNNKNKKEMEVPTAPALSKKISEVYNMFSEVVDMNVSSAKRFETELSNSVPSKRSTLLYTFVQDDIDRHIMEFESGTSSYVITSATGNLDIQLEYDDYSIEQIYTDNYHYSGFFLTPKGKDINYDKTVIDFKSKYANLDIRVVIGCLYAVKELLDVLYEYRYKASPAHTARVLRILFKSLNLIKCYKALLSPSIAEKMTKKEIYVNQEKAMNRTPWKSKFIVKIKEKDFKITNLDFDDPKYGFISFRLLKKVLDDFNLNQFDIDMSELSNTLTNLVFKHITVVRDLSTNINGINIFSELASNGISPNDEIWDVKEPVVLATADGTTVLIAKSGEEMIARILIHGECRNEELTMEQITKMMSTLVLKTFEYVLNKFNERIHEFFRLNDKGINTFDIEHDDNTSTVKGSRNITPKKTVVKGHIRRYKSGLIAYVLPHVRCYEGGEDLAVTLNLN